MLSLGQGMEPCVGRSLSRESKRSNVRPSSEAAVINVTRAGGGKSATVEG